jgi:hypothetical protein
MSKSKSMRWAGHVARIGEVGLVYRGFVDKSEGRRPLGRPRNKWEDYISVDLKDIGLGAGVWT